VAAHRERLNLGWIRDEWQTVAAFDDPRMVRFMEIVAAADGASPPGQTVA